TGSTCFRWTAAGCRPRPYSARTTCRARCRRGRARRSAPCTSIRTAALYMSPTAPRARLTTAAARSLPAARTRSRATPSRPAPATGEPSIVEHADTRGVHCRPFHIDPSGRLLVAAHIQGITVRDGAGFREVPCVLSLFHIGDDGRLDFARSYEIDVGSRTMWWMGMVPL